MEEKTVSVLQSTQSMYNTMWSLLPFAHYHLPSHLEGGRREERGGRPDDETMGRTAEVSELCGDQINRDIFIIRETHTHFVSRLNTLKSHTVTIFYLLTFSSHYYILYWRSLSSLSCFILRLFSCLRLRLRACQEVGNLQLTMQFLTIQTLWRLWTVMVSTILICDDRVNVWCWKDANAQNLFR